MHAIRYVAFNPATHLFICTDPQITAIASFKIPRYVHIHKYIHIKLRYRCWWMCSMLLWIAAVTNGWMASRGSMTRSSTCTWRWADVYRYLYKKIHVAACLCVCTSVWVDVHVWTWQQVLWYVLMMHLKHASAVSAVRICVARSIAWHQTKFRQISSCAAIVHLHFMYFACDHILHFAHVCVNVVMHCVDLLSSVAIL